MKTAPVLSLSLSLVMLLFALPLATSATAQISRGGTPNSFFHDVSPEVNVVALPPIDLEAVLAEEEAERASGDPVPFRYATPRDVEISIENAGTWDAGRDGVLVNVKTNKNMYLLRSGAVLFHWTVPLSVRGFTVTDYNIRPGGRARSCYII